MRILVITTLLVCGMINSVLARSYSLKLVGSKGSSEDNNYLYFQDKSKRVIAQLTIGGPRPKDDLSPIEIRAASVFKNINSKKAFINDVSKEMFTSTNSASSKVLIVSGAAGKMEDRYAKVNGGYDCSRGFTIAGVIVEIWQKGKCLKHLSNLSGRDGKISLKEGVREYLLLQDDRWDSDDRDLSQEEIKRIKENGFKNATKIIIAEQK